MPEPAAQDSGWRAHAGSVAGLFLRTPARLRQTRRCDVLWTTEK